MKLLFIEDGSVDTNELDKLGINYIVFRQGSGTPKIIEVDEGNLTKRYIQDINAISLELSKYKRALQLENEERFKDIDGIWMIKNGKRTKFINNAEELTNYFLDQAKKEFE